MRSSNIAMTKDADDNIDYPIDDDYIDVEQRRADISDSGAAERDDELDRSPKSQITDRSHAYGDYKGSGASNEVDEMIDENAIVENDGRSKTRTFFYPSEAPDRRRWKRLSDIQNGRGENDNTKRTLKADNRRWLDAMSTKLDITEHQHERAQHIVEGIELSNMAHYSAQAVLLAVISLVANEDDWWIRDDPMYKRLVDDVGCDLRDIRNIRRLVRDKSERL